MLVDIAPFVSSMRAENEVLRKNGAAEQARARESLLDDLEAFFQREDLLSVDQVVERTGVHPETVRRAYRKGEVRGEKVGSEIRVSSSCLSLFSKKRRDSVVDDEPVIDYTSPRSRLLDAARRAAV